jgi:hypothetical protein
MAKIPKIPLGGPIQVGASIPNIDVKYGPYTSKQDVIDTLGEEGMDVITQGLTVGIIENKLIVEYWFQGGTDIEHLVKKRSDIELTKVDLKGLVINDTISKHAADCKFVYNGEAVYKVPCVYDNTNCILVYCNLLNNGTLVNKVYLIAGKVILNIWEDNNIPSWVKPYLPKENVNMLTEVYNSLMLKVSDN